MIEKWLLTDQSILHTRIFRVIPLKTARSGSQKTALRPSGSPKTAMIPRDEAKLIFSCDEATLQERVSARWSVYNPFGRAFAFRPTRSDLCRERPCFFNHLIFGKEL